MTVALRIAFLDLQNWEYTVESPYERPIGGSQSAMCYLATELAQLGHSVTVFNGSQRPTECRGVQIRNNDEIKSPSLPNSFDVMIVLSIACGRALRRDFGVTIPLVLWNHTAADQPSVQELNRLNERKSWSGFAFVSNWQLEKFASELWIDRNKSRIMRNAVSPAFVNDSNIDPWFVAERPPTLFYSSTPFRGLDVLLQAFPMIRAAIPGTRLRVFSSMRVYQVRPEEDEYQNLYRLSKTVDGVEYIGSVGQSQLARELAGTAALAYPSTFAETSCIAAIEAMALGAAVFTTRTGALPETTGGLASMTEFQTDRGQLANSFAAMAINDLAEMQENPSVALARCEQRIDFVRKHYLWPDRAREWVGWLSEIVRTG
jgi:glycosyltransferase involved in cell wall biosynthesis